MHILRRLLFCLLAIVLVAGVLGAWHRYAIREQQEALAEARIKAAVATGLAESSLRATIKAADLVFDLVAGTVADRDFSTLAEDRQITRKLVEVSRRLPDMRALWLANPDGRVFYATSLGAAAADLQGGDLYRAHSAGASLIVGSLHTGKSADESYFPISRRFERGGSMSGVLLAAFNPGMFQRFGRALGLPAQASVMFLTANGQLVGTTGEPDAELASAIWKGLADRPGTNGREFASYTTALAGDGGQAYLIGYQPLPDVDLTAIYAIPQAVLLQDWQRSLWLGSSAIGLLLVVVAGGILLLMVAGRRQTTMRHTLGLRTAEAAQAAERLALAVDTTGIGIFDYRIGERTIAWAGVESGFFGLKSGASLTARKLLKAVHPGDRATLLKRLRSIRTARADTRFDTEFRMRHPEFGAIWVAARAKLFVQAQDGEESRVGRLIGTLRDITERRLLQEHRETVLREINHRIKNSLQLMNSIMNLQSRRIASPDERARFESARRRLISLATVYAHLDDTTRPDVVDLVPFLRRLCQDFGVAYMADGRLNLSFNAKGGTTIGAVLAVPLGMAVGEILVNVSLNGFDARATGSVAVDTEVSDDGVQIRIAYDGRDIDQVFATDGAALGRLLINAFVDQLGGTFSAVESGSAGTVLTIAFHPPPVPAPRAGYPAAPSLAHANA